MSHADKEQRAQDLRAVESVADSAGTCMANAERWLRELGSLDGLADQVGLALLSWGEIAETIKANAEEAQREVDGTSFFDL